MSKRTAAYNWGNDASAGNKAKIIADRFDGDVPDCLWYALGGDYVPNRYALRAAVAELFQGGNIEDINIVVIPESREPEGGVLMVHNATLWKPKITIQGRKAYLFRAGYNDDKGRCFCFLTQWSTARFRPGATVRVVAAALEFLVGLREGGVRDQVFPLHDLVVVETRFDNANEASGSIRNALAACPILASMVYANMLDTDGLLNLRQESFEVVVLKLPDGSSVEISADMLETAGSE